MEKNKHFLSALERSVFLLTFLPSLVDCSLD